MSLFNDKINKEADKAHQLDTDFLDAMHQAFKEELKVICSGNLLDSFLLRRSEKSLKSVFFKSREFNQFHLNASSAARGATGASQDIFSPCKKT